ncbi:MAG TPA: hypothetical protein VD993_15615 [Chitinophagaceae bacterium]|nr:hypothetical protein [Chitinophagaceae bacterium]
MLTQHNYCPLPPDWDDEIIECCPENPTDEPPGSDCCYDTWKEQLDRVNRKFKEADERAKRLQRQLDSAILFRDKYKTWHEDLFRANELAEYICQHMHVFASQVDNICCTTQNGVQAVNLLFCMVRDFYLRVDKLKEEYDQLINCIKCLNRPELNGGIIDCLGEYYKKLEVVINTRDKIIELLVKAMKMAFELNSAICSRYGLQKIVLEWQRTLNCRWVSTEEDQYKGKHKPDKGDKDCRLPETCELEPMLTFPLKNDPYYTDLKHDRQYWEDRIDTLNDELLTANKEKEVLLTNKTNLEKAIVEVDPKTKCK